MATDKAPVQSEWPEQRVEI